ncbi:hypothetical protein ACTMTJ_44745 [Phytohabitans sp. LJ34]|uniref:hypothetical protein n=1 Tax=Phytohabitans sp. LJ34 TaxID=3452217 RepID=UPI003F88CF2D
MVGYLRRVGVTITAIGVILAGSLFVSGRAAQASGCDIELDLQFNNGVLTASHWAVCFEPPRWRTIPLQVLMEKYVDVGGGTRPNFKWVTVARGRGDISYTCVSGIAHEFRVELGEKHGLFQCG